MKLSARSSIIALFVSLLLLLGASVISINYLILNNILVKSAEITLSHLAQRIVQQTINYVHPLDERSSMSESLINQNVITPDTSEKFRKYLVNLIKDNPALYGAYWGDPQGNLYLVERRDQNVFTSETVTHHPNPLKAILGGNAGKETSSFTSETVTHDSTPPKTVEGTINEKGDFIDTPKLLPATFDSRVRPWYIAATKLKRQVWTLYLFKAFQDKKPTMGITSAVPIYAPDGKLAGVFGIDMTVGALTKYILNLNISKNAVIFICDDKGKLVAATQVKESALRRENTSLSALSELSSPWAPASYDLFKKHKKWLFYYTYHKEKYVAAYIRMPTLSEDTYYVAIVIPEFDIVHSLRDMVYVSVMATVIVFLIGFLLVYTLSGRITRNSP